MKIVIKNAGNSIISEHKLDTEHQTIAEAIAEILTELDWPLEAGDKIEIIDEGE